MATTVLWRRLDIPGLDRCVIESTPDGHRLSGTALVAVDGAPCEIRYSVLTDPHWRTRSVGVHVGGLDADRRLAMACDGEGSWSVADAPLLDLFGATDVDFAWTPATNTLPILRLGLDVGEAATVTVAMIDFPGHHVGRATQHYTRTAADIYRFETGDFTAELRIGEDGLVAAYEGLWSSVAWSTADPPIASSTEETSHSPENS